MLDDPEISPRIQDAVAGLLGLNERDVREWTAADCRSALADRFKIVR
jgi:hypothetical protein